MQLYFHEMESYYTVNKFCSTSNHMNLFWTAREHLHQIKWLYATSEQVYFFTVLDATLKQFIFNYGTLESVGGLFFHLLEHRSYIAETFWLHDFSSANGKIGSTAGTFVCYLLHDMQNEVRTQMVTGWSEIKSFYFPFVWNGADRIFHAIRSMVVWRSNWCWWLWRWSSWCCCFFPGLGIVVSISMLNEISFRKDVKYIEFPTLFHLQFDLRTSDYSRHLIITTAKLPSNTTCIAWFKQRVAHFVKAAQKVWHGS